MKTKLGIIFDSIAICFILFIIEYFWLYKFIKNAFFVFFILILLNILTFIAIFKFSIKKHNLEKITFQDQKLAKKCFLSMTFQSQNSLKIYLEKLLFATSLDENIYENAQSFFYISIKTGCDEKDFHRAYDFISSKNNSKPLYFICSKTTPEFLNLVSTSPIKFEIFNETDLFLLMKDKNLFPIEPDAPLSKHQRLLSLKSKFTGTITRSHFKEFFFSGLSLIVISVIIPFSTYYLIFGTFLLALSLISLFFKNKEVVSKSKASLSSLISNSK